ncbi:23S rRNA (cytidine(2498)-2'-O)-methyltransferase RlmM [Nitrincola alkalilacustris]|uniref:23S rRNA (cytidine(2498)-2'-O)-methyltransferase RlmM n=1 Tax=Nitrincola alkalilacustris TaxID=1571224 RepID=UPI00124CD3E2|nr:23S rRNA (cytidine(2498)-2'-O)-methyltransferase RlmM [Nitrincola alkalilacustris]
MQTLDTLILYCRSGFERECAAEFTERAAMAGFSGHPSYKGDEAYVIFNLHQPGAALQVMEEIEFRSLIFVRQWVACLPMMDDLPGHDRVTPVLEQAAALPLCNELFAETPDTTSGRELQGFARKFSSALVQQMRKQNRLLPRKQKADWRMHLFVLSGKCLWLGVSPRRNSSPWEMGILRLKFPSSAPSRSTLKLEEAWHWFLSRQEQEQRLGGGKTAVDLGAAPGGWTWQLVQQGMFVTAVDNGPMGEELMESGQVTHLREDAFSFAPSKPVYWMVCDVVEKPSRIADLVVLWAKRGWCREAVFNLKLPMKQRYREVVSCLDTIRSELDAAGVTHRIEARHLYHDREEITCFLDLRRE